MRWRTAAQAGTLVVAAVVAEALLVMVARTAGDREVAAQASIVAVLVGNLALLTAVTHLIRGTQLISAMRGRAGGTVGVAAAVGVVAVGFVAAMLLPNLAHGIDLILGASIIGCLILGTLAWRSSFAIVQFIAMVLGVAAIVSTVLLLALDVPHPDRMLDSAVDPGFDPGIGDGPTHVAVLGVLLLAAGLMAIGQAVVLAVASGLTSRQQSQTAT